MRLRFIELRFTVTNAPSVWRQNQILVKDCKHIRAALGLHPQLAHTHGYQTTATLASGDSDRLCHFD